MLETIYTPEIIYLAANISHSQLLSSYHIKHSQTAQICGSKIVVTLTINKGAICSYGQEIQACVLAQASAAILAHHIIGSTIEDIQAGIDHLTHILKHGETPKNKSIYRELELFAPAHQLPERHEAILMSFKAVFTAFRHAKQ